MADLDVDAPPWRTNPSAWRHRVPIALIAMLGAGIAAYMGAYQYRLVDSFWDPVFGAGSMRVLDSDVSHQMRAWARLPDGVLGAIAYLGDAIWGLAGSTRRWQYRPWLVILFGIDVIPLGLVSAILIVLQGTVVGSWCFLCMVTAVISLILVGLAWDEVRATLGFLWRVWRATDGDKRVLWDTFWGRRHPIADEVALEREAR